MPARAFLHRPATFLPKVLAAAGYEAWQMGKPSNAFTAGIQSFETNIKDAGHGALSGTDRAHPQPADWRPPVDGGRKRRREERVTAVEDGNAQP